MHDSLYFSKITNYLLFSEVWFKYKFWRRRLLFEILPIKSETSHPHKYPHKYPHKCPYKYPHK